MLSLRRQCALTNHQTEPASWMGLVSGVGALEMPFDNRSKLLRLLGNIAFYNDKGIDCYRHNPAQVDSERAIGLAKVRELVAAIGPESLPSEFLKAVDSGDVATDFTGRYIDVVRAHGSREAS